MSAAEVIEVDFRPEPPDPRVKYPYSETMLGRLDALEDQVRALRRRLALTERKVSA
jgi:hypothetical protein